MNKITLILTFFLLFGCSQQTPKNLGLKTIKDRSMLSECPDKPNCVISYKDSAKREGQYLEAFQGSGNKDHDYNKVVKILEKNSSVKIVSKNGNYIHATFTSTFLRFIDDVEFYFGEEKKIHFRSASRLGRSDFGVNKKRIEDIRFKFQQSF